MEKVERYRQVFSSFKELCAEGNQPSSFRAYCMANGVDQSQMRQVLGDEFQNIKTLPGYCCVNSRLYANIYERFKQLCAQGSQEPSLHIAGTLALPSIKYILICIESIYVWLDCPVIQD